VLTQTPPQFVVPIGHIVMLTTHAPATQVCVAEQTRPQAPQWSRAVLVFTQLPAHTVSPAAHGARVHVPA
jgi:hypothetical protein